MRILYFDICAIIIQVILIISLYFRKMLSGRTNKLYLIILCQLFITTILDIWVESYGIWIPIKESNLQIRKVVGGLYYLLRNLTTPLYHLFICSITGTWHILRKNKWLQLILIAPYVIIFGTLISNPFNHLVYYYDENMAFHRGPLLYVLYVASVFYLICGVTYLFYYRKTLTMDKFISLMCMYPLNVLAVLIQLFYMEYLVEMFMTSLTLLLVALVIQRPEEIINPIIGVRSYIAYTTDIKKAFCMKKPIRIIFIKLVNYDALLSLLEYDDCNMFMKSVASQLLQTYKDEHISMDLYYLENGLFTLVAEEEAPEKLKSLADDILNKLSVASQFHGLEIRLEPCICILRCPQDIDNYESLLSFGNSFYTYLPSDGTVNDITQEKDLSVFQLRNEIDGILSDAIVNKRFMMYYQPIYSVKEKRFLSAEALIRLQDEKYGFISPELFITAAEKNGTILQIGDIVLDEVCGFLSKCKKEGIPIEYIELNLSMNQCMQKELKEKVLYYLKKYELKPEQINLEITETAANMAQDIVEENILKLSEEGIYFSLDDYGTGYSNISRIMSLPFHIIKLDKSLSDKVGDKKMNILLKNTIRMLKEIGMEIVVEGVETKETLQQFIKMECDYIQGYYFSKPLPEEEFLEFIRKSLH